MKGKALIVAAIAVCAVVAMQMPLVRSGADVMKEELALLIDPSAKKAYEFGNRHFDAARSHEYNINRAERLYERAYSLDKNLPYLQHQRARIAFLRGDFETALQLIDEELAGNPEPSPSSFYIRGLIKGFKGDYAGAADDYRTYRRHDPTNWAAAADLAWVLLRNKQSAEALFVVDQVLPHWVDNPWLLNSKAIALYEMGRIDEAQEPIRAAAKAVEDLTPEDWSRAYPGNDPMMAAEALEVFRESVISNMHTITVAREGGINSMR